MDDRSFLKPHRQAAASLQKQRKRLSNQFNEERVEPWPCSSSISAYLVITPSKITAAAIL